MFDSLELSPRKLQGGAGIYEAGKNCYVKLFVTDGHRVIPVNGRVLNGDDLLQAYEWGRLEEREANGTVTSEPEEVEEAPYQEEQDHYDFPDNWEGHKGTGMDDVI